MHAIDDIGQCQYSTSRTRCPAPLVHNAQSGHINFKFTPKRIVLRTEFLSPNANFYTFSHQI